MRVRRTLAIDERRKRIIDLLTFIHDFNELDTTLMIEQARDNVAFVEAAEAVLESAVGPTNSIEALRGFCIQAMMGSAPPQRRDLERVRPRMRVSPYSVPLELLRTFIGGNFDIRNLSTFAETVNFDLPYAFETGGALVIWMTPQDEWRLVTTLWVRLVGATNDSLKVLRLSAYDEGSRRRLFDGRLGVFAEEPMACCWQFPPNSAFKVEITSANFTCDETIALVACEGWRYMRR